MKIFIIFIIGSILTEWVPKDRKSWDQKLRAKARRSFKLKNGLKTISEQRREFKQHVRTLGGGQTNRRNEQAYKRKNGKIRTRTKTTTTTVLKTTTIATTTSNAGTSKSTTPIPTTTTTTIKTTTTRRTTKPIPRTTTTTTTVRTVPSFYRSNDQSDLLAQFAIENIGSNFRNGNLYDMDNACFTCTVIGTSTEDTLQKCGQLGKLKTCGRNSVCQIEVRKRDSKVVGLNTLCKSRQACLSAQKQNFGAGPVFRHQCRPEDNLTTSRFGASVCRQCFATCSGDSATNYGDQCFSAEYGIPGGVGQFYYDLFDSQNACLTTACPLYGRPWWSAALLDCQSDPGVTSPGDCDYTVKPARMQMAPIIDIPKSGGVEAPVEKETSKKKTFDELSNHLHLTNETEYPFYKRFLLDYKIEELLKCSAGLNYAIDVQTDFQFEILRQHSAHASRITYLRLDTGTIEFFSFNIGETDLTKVKFDGQTLTCMGGKQPQCQNLTARRPVPVVVLEAKFKPRDGATFEPHFEKDWAHNRYSVSGSFYNAMCGADGVQHMRANFPRTN